MAHCGPHPHAHPNLAALTPTAGPCPLSLTSGPASCLGSRLAGLRDGVRSRRAGITLSQGGGQRVLGLGPHSPWGEATLLPPGKASPRWPPGPVETPEGFSSSEDECVLAVPGQWVPRAPSFLAERLLLLQALNHSEEKRHQPPGCVSLSPRLRGSTAAFPRPWRLPVHTSASGRPQGGQAGPGSCFQVCVHPVSGVSRRPGSPRCGRDGSAQQPPTLPASLAPGPHRDSRPHAPREPQAPGARHAPRLCTRSPRVRLHGLPWLLAPGWRLQATPH